MESSSRPPITDSPWFWVYLFGTAALVGLLLIGDHYGQRQARLERQYQAKERSGLATVRDPGNSELSEPDNTLIGLRPLYVAVALAAVVGWVLLWWRHFRRVARPAGKAEGEAEQGATSKGASG